MKHNTYTGYPGHGMWKEIVYPRRVNEGFNSVISVGYNDQHTPDEFPRTHRPKRSDVNKKLRITARV